MLGSLEHRVPDGMRGATHGLLAASWAVLASCGAGEKTVVDAQRDVVAVIPDDGNHAPVLHKVGDRIVEVGKPVTIELKADDADADALVFSAHSLPKGASFSRIPPIFRWTPTTVGQVASPTFLVSDGVETDRETIRIEVVSETQNHAPRFQLVGDQAVEVGQTLTLLLQAVDADGDTLTFGISGEKPGGSAIDANSGTFSFTPQPGSEGTVPKVSFTVSDGEATDTMEVAVYVLAPGQNKPPAFKPMANQVAEVGQKFVMVVEAGDPEGDPLTFAFVGSLPPASAFDPGTARFTWTPAAGDAGTTLTVTFSVTDGNYTILSEVDIEVLDPNVAAGKCVDDVNEPNNTAAQATPLVVGEYEKLSLCDTSLSPLDEDWFRVSLSTGQTLALTLNFVHAEGDIDMALYFEGSTAAAIALADGASDKELLAYTATAPETLLLKVFGTGQVAFQSGYTLTVSTEGLECQDDMIEPNDSKLQPAGINGNGTHSLMFCPGNLDVFAIELSCGETLLADLAHEPLEGELDLWVYRGPQATSPTVTSSQVGATEALFYEAPRDEEVLLLVRGSPPESTMNDYVLTTEVVEGTPCSDDGQEPNDKRSQAVALDTPNDIIADLVLCCDEDWFFVPMVLGDGALLSVNFSAGLDVRAELYTVDDDEPLVVAEPDGDGLLLELEAAPFSGNYYLRVEGTPGTAYSVEVLTFESAGCTSSKACPGSQVCWESKGACIDSFCYDEFDCPLGQDMPCVENRCLPGCTYDSDCKLGNACKGLEDGTYCGASGTLATGAACKSLSECKGQASCAFKNKGGYCSKLGCLSNTECGSDGSCVQLSTGDTLCAKKCVSNSDCRTAEGYTCQPKTLPSGLETAVCLPTSS